jgi:hypothetical protein
MHLHFIGKFIGYVYMREHYSVALQIELDKYGWILRDSDTQSKTFCVKRLSLCFSAIQFRLNESELPNPKKGQAGAYHGRA